MCGGEGMYNEQLALRQLCVVSEKRSNGNLYAQ